MEFIFASPARDMDNDYYNKLEQQHQALMRIVSINTEAEADKEATQQTQLKTKLKRIKKKSFINIEEKN